MYSSTLIRTVHKATMSTTILLSKTKFKIYPLFPEDQRSKLMLNFKMAFGSETTDSDTILIRLKSLRNDEIYC